MHMFGSEVTVAAMVGAKVGTVNGTNNIGVVVVDEYGAVRL